MVNSVAGVVNIAPGSDVTAAKRDRRRYGMYIAPTYNDTDEGHTESEWINHLDKMDSAASMIPSITNSANGAPSDAQVSPLVNGIDQHARKPHGQSTATSVTNTQRVAANLVHPTPTSANASVYGSPHSANSITMTDSRNSLEASSVMSTPGVTPDGHSLITSQSEDEDQLNEDGLLEMRMATRDVLSSSPQVSSMHYCASPEPDMSETVSLAGDSSTNTRSGGRERPTSMRSLSEGVGYGGAAPMTEATRFAQRQMRQGRQRYSMGPTRPSGKRASIYLPPDAQSPPGVSTSRLLKRRSLTRRATYNIGGLPKHLAGAGVNGQSIRPSSGMFDGVDLRAGDPSPNDLQSWEAAKQQLRARKTTRRKRSIGQTNVQRVSAAGEERIIGNPIKEGHVNYVLMYNMLTGIRVAVSRCTAKPFRELVDADFVAAHKLAFDITGGEMTPSSKYDFKFKDYAPWVFRHIRRKFGVTSSDYLVSLTSRYILSELGSPGKSGSFFYFSQDYRFIIKTIHHAEHKFLRKILKHYWEHVEQNPHTLISRFFGLHRVKMPHGRKIHFVVMSNINPPNRDIHETYDLKGSTVGRILSDDDHAKQPQLPMKDLNWIQRGQQLEFGPQKRDMLVHQMERDVSLLSRLRIMDYSLLVEQLPGRPGQQTKVTAVRKAVVTSDPVAFDPESEKLHDDHFDERRLCVFQQDEGGFQATDNMDNPIDIIYYIGIIDILTPYSMTKRMEHMFKSIGHDSNGISAVRPSLYGRRFLNFMINAIRSAGEGRPNRGGSSGIGSSPGRPGSIRRSDSMRRKRLSRVHTS
ncbi:hypothetical protein BDF19DRAFT_424790 [Syncephalis fuscata]|nr:hypothetical protein BDF19DRAFT_424790 [Syncephalis fuscata]